MSRARLVVAPLAAAGAAAVLLAGPLRRPGAAGLVMGAGTATALLGLLHPHLAGRLARRVEAVGHRVAQALTIVVVVSFHTLVVLPAWAVGRAVGRLRRRPAPAPTWVDHPGGGRHGTRMFATPGPPARGSSLVPLLVLVVVAAGTVVMLRGDGGPQGPSSLDVPRDPGHTPAALDGQPGVEQLFAEEGRLLAALRPHPDLGWVLPARAGGSAMTVADGLRASVQTGEAGPEVWFFGGSTMFGSGQRDGHTIPSVVGALAAAAGTPIRVRNHGVHAYTSLQEVEAFEAALAVAPAPPALVVFYDGFNDTAVSLVSEVLGVPPGEPVRAPFSQFDPSGPTDGPRAPLPLSPPAARHRAVADAYEVAVERARTAGAAAGVEVVHVWQPNAYTRTPTEGERAALAAKGIDDLQQRVHGRVHAAVRDHLPEGVADLGDVLDDAPTVFYDEVHTNELGAALVAEALLELLRPRLAAT